MAETAASDEAVVVAAAIAQFEADTAPVGGGETEAVDPWQRAALLEGVSAKAGVGESQGGGERWLS